MASSPLPNYLCANRKRLALAQEDVAFLLGLEGGESVCRHERFTRIPSVETVFAYEIIFQRPASELFAGLYQKIELEVAARAEALGNSTNQPKPNPRTLRKRQTLANIAAHGSGEPPKIG